MSNEMSNTETTENNMILMLERVALNPEVDVSKLEKMLEMQERILDRNAKVEFSEAMTEVQSLLPHVAKDADNPQTRSKYSTHEAIARAIKPVYTSKGFSITFSEGESVKENCIRVIGILRHKAGHSENHHIDVPLDGAGIKGTANKTATHAAGSTYSYARRYLTCMIFDVATGDDNDGNGNTKFISGKAVNELNAKLKATNSDVGIFLGYMNANTIEDITEQDYPRALAALTEKAKLNAKENKK